jgi:hypothetical protein
MKRFLLACLCVLWAVSAAAATAEKDGLAATVTPAAEHVAVGESPTFHVRLKNTSDKAFLLFDANCWVYDINTPNGSWACLLEDAKTGKKYKPTVTVRPMIARLAIPVTLAPGKVHKTKISLTRALSYVPVGEKPDANAKPRLRLRRPLPDGSYKLRVTMTFTKPKNLPVPPKVKAPYWTGTLHVTTAEFQVGGKAAAVKPGVWHKLYADEPWYKRRKGAEQVVKGTLKVAPKPKPGGLVVSTLQRSCHYFLGELRVYTGGRRVPVLEALDAKPVALRGKRVDMNLEGQHLKELWPAAVRLAPDQDE